MKKKSLSVGIILLFIGVSVAPSINFTVIKASKDNNPPNTPSNPIPLDNTTEIPINNLYLWWDGGDPDIGDFVQYTVFFGNTSNPPMIGGIMFTPWNNTPLHWRLSENLVFNTKYFWKIVAMDNHYETSEGPLWSFTTLTDIIPPKITNVTANPPTQNLDGYVNITCDVTDNFAVDEVWVNIFYPDFTTHNYSMNLGYFFNQTYSQIGSYQFSIWVNDTNGNTNLSSGHMFQIMPVLKRALLIGLIIDVNSSGLYVISFKAKSLLFIGFNPFSFNLYTSNEEIFVLRDYPGYLGPGLIIGIFLVVV